MKKTPPKRGRRARLMRRYLALFCLSFALCIGCAGAAAKILLEERRADAANAEAQSMMRAGTQGEALPEGAVLFTESAPAGEINADFAELMAANGDLAGWLTAGADIDLPVVQGDDNAVYLTRDFYGNANSAGTLFLDAGSALTDDHLVVYGHNMKSGAMFGHLPDYRKLDYLKQYPLIQFRTVYQDAAQQNCVPFAVFDASMEKGDPDYFDIRRFTFASDAEKQAFIDELRARSIFDIPVDVSADDELISLVTCSYSNADGRFILAMRRLRAGESAETAAEWVRQATQK